MALTPAPQPPDEEAAPETEFPNLYVAGIEVTQGIQNLANDMPLVAGRRTYARVYIGVTGAQSWPNTWGALEARRNGQQIGWIWPENGPITARASAGDRESLDDSLQFRLPASWLSGSVTLTTFVFSYTIETPFTEEPTAADNADTEFVTFHEGQALTLHLAPIHLHRSYHPSDVERIYELGPGAGDGGGFAAADPTVGEVNRILAGLFRYMPLWKVNVDSLTTPVTPAGHVGGHEFDIGGPCRSTVVEVLAYNHLVISDWTILVEDPSEYDPESGLTYLDPDRDELRIMDRTYFVGQFKPNPDGTGNVVGGSDNVGPAAIPGAPAYAYPCLEITEAVGEPNEILGLYRVFYDWDDEREYFAGMIHPTLRAAYSGGLSDSGSDAVTLRMTDSFDDEWTWWHSGAETMAHEITHQAGLNHVPCKDANGDGVPDELAGGALDLTHPAVLTFPDCYLSEADPAGYYGFDTEWQRFGLPGPSVISNDPNASAPLRAYPLMAYQFPGWIDPYHYCRLLTYYGVPCSPTALDLPWDPPNPEPDGSDPFAAATPPPAALEPGTATGVVRYTGLEDGTWELELLARNDTPTPDQVERISAATREPPDPERPWLVVLGAAGEVVWQAPLPAPERPHEADGHRRSGLFVVPLPPDATGIEVRGWDAQVTATITPKGGVPDVAGLFRDTADGETVEPDDEVLVTFIAGDPDGDPLRFILLYAPDREHWQVVGISDEPEIRVPVRDLPSGPDPAFRLIAFDGWGTGEAILEAPELGAPRNPPTVLILASGPRTYPLRAHVRLDASAFDLEDRTLPGDAIRWSSSIDGELGDGAELSTRTLSPGRHVITATATDSDGLEGSATYALEVDGSVAETLPGAELEAGMAGIFDRLAAGLDPAPAGGVEDHPDFAWLPLAAGGGAVAVLIVVGTLAAIRMRRPVATVGATQSISVGAAQDAPPTPPVPDGRSTWVETGQLGTSGSMGRGGRNMNELSMDDTAGKEEAGPASGDVTAGGGEDAVPGSGDVTIKGSKIKEN
ncbi:MAG TPA: hypothetical protein VFX65_05125 [Candidatus Limnocylindrales bacterium]|nr:hypothetical protein [Candidatus Limnocylindrales bacterium]